MATRGVVGPKLDPFETSLARNVTEFERILVLPEDYIIHRRKHERLGHVERLADPFGMLPATSQRALRTAIRNRQ